MPNGGCNCSCELYSVRNGKISPTTFRVFKHNNPDRATITRSINTQPTITLVWWSSAPDLKYFDGDNTYVLFRFKEDDYVAYMMKGDSVYRNDYGEWEAVFHTVLPDPKISQAVNDYRRITLYSNHPDHSNKEHDMELSSVNKAANKAVKIAFGYTTPDVPLIKKVFYNEPHTIVKWSDGTTTVVGCAEGEEFSKELGLSVAIAKKYFEILGFPYPRAALKKVVENSHDQTAKTKARKEFKASKKRKANTEE